MCSSDLFERPVGTYGRQLTAWYRWATPRAYRRVDAIVSLSPAMESLAQRWLEGIAKTYLVPNSIDPAEIGIKQAEKAGSTQSIETDSGPPGVVNHQMTNLAKIQQDRSQQIPELLFVGRVEPLKGLGTLLGSVAQLHKLGYPVTLHCVGSVKASYEPELRHLIQDLGIQSAVKFSPPVARIKLGKLYQSCAEIGRAHV